MKPPKLFAIPSFSHLPLIMALFLAAALPLQASLLIYEGFDASYTAGNINGQTVTATGLTGNYSSSQTNALFQTNGLTFGSLAVSGGSVSQSGVTGVNFGARLDAGTATGTLYTSYLINFSSAGDNASRASASINQDSATSAKRSLSAIADMDTTRYAGVGYDSVTNATSSGIQLAGNTTYMVLASFSNVGSALDSTNTGVATLWIITTNQFAYFQTNGFTDLNLNSADIGSGDSDVFARVTNTATSGTYTFATNRYLQLSLNANSAARTYTMDEVRYGASLGDVTPLTGNYWAGNDMTRGGSGTWTETGGTSWRTSDTDGTGGAFTPAVVATFGGASAGTVTVSGTVSPSAGIHFTTTGYTIQGDGIVFNGPTASVNTVSTDTNVTATMSSQLSGTNGMTKLGSGTLVLTGSSNNTLTGTTIVSAGVLRLNKTAGTQAVAGSLEVASGATLLLSASGQVSDTSAITLSGGTIKRESGVSETFGNLNLTESSTLDYGSGATGTLQFGTYTPSSVLVVSHFLEGNKLVFASDLTGQISGKFTFDNGFTSSWDSGSGLFTITAIPESSTYVAALGLLGLMLWSGRRSLFRPSFRSKH